jgi:hypothetical protein
MLYTGFALAVSHDPDSILLSGTPAQREIVGFCYNIDNFVKTTNYLGLALDNYGANSTVNYSVPVFPHVTTLSDALPQISMGKNDYIIIEVTVPDTDWLDVHSLFNITPYFYYYYENGPNVVYASENITIQFFELFGTPGETIRICVTPNKTIGAQYETAGYIVSAMPEEYLDATTFQILFRVGTINGSASDKPDQLSINRFTKVTFFQATNDSDFTGSDYYTASEIISSFPTALMPSGSTYDTYLAEYDGIVTYLSGEGYDPTQCLKYLSNVYGTSYAMDNFYTAITVSPPAGLEANNTGENYFNSQGIPTYSDGFINLEDISYPYVYVLSVNQNLMGSALTSNVQVYNNTTLALVNQGLIVTSPDLPSFSTPGYPYVASNTYPLFQINAFNISDLIGSGATQIIITERISYNPINFYQTSYDYPGKAYFFFGNEIPTVQADYLQTNYGITINYIPPLD